MSILESSYMNEARAQRVFSVVNTIVIIAVSIVGFLIKSELSDMKDRITRLENAFIQAGSSNLHN